MRSTKIIYVTLATLLLGVFIACGRLEPVSTSPTDYPSEPPAYTGLPNKRPKAKVLTQYAAQSVTSLLANGELRINAKRVAPQRTQPIHKAKIDTFTNIEEGMILISPPTEEAPFGFMKKVTKVETVNNELVFQTVDATLAEAIAGTDMSPSEAKTTTVKIPVDAYFSTSPKEGTGISPQNFPRRLDPKAFKGKLTPQWDIDIIPAPVRPCKTESPIAQDGLELVATGCIQMRLWISIDIEIGWWWIFPYLQGFGSSVKGYLGTNFDLNLNKMILSQQLFSIDSNGNRLPYIPLPGNLNFNLINYSVPLSTFWVGPIPIVVVTGVTGDFAFGEGQLSGSVNGSATLNSSIPTFNLGLGSPSDPVKHGFYCGNTVTNGNWGCREDSNVNQKFAEFESQAKAWNPLSSPFNGILTASANIGVSYKAKLSLGAYAYLFGVLGLGAKIEPYIKPRLNASISATALTGQPLSVPQVRFSGSISGGIDGRIEAGINLLFWNYQTEISNGPISPLFRERELLRLFDVCWMGGARC